MLRVQKICKPIISNCTYVVRNIYTGFLIKKWAKPRICVCSFLFLIARASRDDFISHDPLAPFVYTKFYYFFKPSRLFERKSMYEPSYCLFKSVPTTTDFFTAVNYAISKYLYGVQPSLAWFTMWLTKLHTMPKEYIKDA